MSRDQVRTGVVWDAVQRRLEHLTSSDEGRARIVDIGGGTGGFAVRLAQQGHVVTVVDPSPDALAALGYQVEWHAYPMAHAVCPEEVVAISDWLGKVLAPQG